MASQAEQVKERVLIVAPIGRDAQAAADQLATSKLHSLICVDLDDLRQKLVEGGALALITEEAFNRYEEFAGGMGS